jgi:hypothetical protein
MGHLTIAGQVFTVAQTLALPSLSMQDVNVLRTATGSTQATFTVALSASLPDPVIVSYATADGTAMATKGDYVPVSGRLTIPAGELTATFEVPILGATRTTANDTFFVNLGRPVNAVIASGHARCTIVNHFPTFEFSAPSYSVSEGAGLATITVKQRGGSVAASAVDYATADGTAKGSGPDRDYTPQSGTLSFAANQDSATFQIPIMQDTLHEPSETVLLRLSNPVPAAQGARLAPQKTAVLTISDDDNGGSFQFARSSYVVDAATTATSVRLSVVRAAGMAGSVSVHYATSDGTAAAGADYTATSGDLTFSSTGAAAFAQTFDVPIMRRTGGARSFAVTLSAASGGATLGPQSTATVTILGSQPTLSFNSAMYHVSTTQRTAVITVKRSAPLAGVATIHYVTTPGTASNGGIDYSDVAGTLTFAANVTTAAFAIPISRNPFVDAAKTVNLTLDAPTWTLGTASVDPLLGSSILTIENPNLPPTVEFGAPLYTVSERTPETSIAVTRRGDLQGTVTVDYAVAGGTATSGVDYVLKPGTLTFLENQVLKSVPITILNDKLTDGTETVQLALRNPTWSGGTAVIGAVGTTTVNIIDSGPAVQFSAASYITNESSSIVAIAVKRSGSLAAPATVGYAATGGTAIRDVGSGGDYVLDPGTLFFGAGQAQQMFTIRLRADGVADGDKTIDLALNAPSGVALGTPATAEVTIKDVDVAGKVSFSAESFSVAETEGFATITITRTGGTASAATIHYATVDADPGTTALAGTDYASSSGTLTFGRNETAKTITIPVFDNGVPDRGAVGVVVALSGPAGGLALGTPTTATLWIVRE